MADYTQVVLGGSSARGRAFLMPDPVRTQRHLGGKAWFKSRSQLRVADVDTRTATPRDPTLTRWGAR